MKTRNVIVIEMASHLLQPPLEISQMQVCEHGLVGDNKRNKYIADEYFLHDVRDSISW